MWHLFQIRLWMCGIYRELFNISCVYRRQRTALITSFCLSFEISHRCYRFERECLWRERKIIGFFAEAENLFFFGNWEFWFPFQFMKPDHMVSGKHAQFNCCFRFEKLIRNRGCKIFCYRQLVFIKGGTFTEVFLLNYSLKSVFPSRR